MGSELLIKIINNGTLKNLGVSFGLDSFPYVWNIFEIICIFLIAGLDLSFRTYYNIDR